MDFMTLLVKRVRPIRLLTTGLIIFLCCVAVAAQTEAGPSRTQCKQWDDSYVFLFDVFLGIGILLPTALNTLLPPLLGKRFWVFASPRLRLVYLSLFAAGVLATLFVALPFVIGFGQFIFIGVGPQYLACESQKFNGNGLLFGLIGKGLAAVSQWPFVLMLLIAASIVGGLIAYLISVTVVKRVGLPSRIREAIV